MTDADQMFSLFKQLDDKKVTRARDVLRSPMGYPGGKQRSLPHLLPLLPYRLSYVEVFGGSGAVLIARNTSKLEVFNDRYAGVTSFYMCLADRQKKDRLLERLEHVIHSREYFEWCKETWESMADDVERAARWYVMNQMSFVSKGVAFARATGSPGQHGRKFHNNMKFFEPLHQRLRNVQVENQDWRDLLADYDHPEAVFYLDPPYLGVYKGTYEHELTTADHIEMLDRVFSMKGFVAVSAYANPETAAIYDSRPWDSIHTWEVYQSIQALAFTESNGKADYEGEVSRRKAIEVLYVKEAR